MAVIMAKMRRSRIKDLGCWTQVHPDEDWILSAILRMFVFSYRKQLKQNQCFHDAMIAHKIVLDMRFNLPRFN